jgi:hypothetical protein
MKRPLLKFFLLICLPVLFAPPRIAQAAGGEALYHQAVKMEIDLDLFKAPGKYREAREQLLKEGNSGLADKCRFAMMRIEIITADYPYTEAGVREIIKGKYPRIPLKRVDEVIKEDHLPNIIIGRERYYFRGFTSTLNHLYADFRAADEAAPRRSGSPAEFLIDAYGPYVYPKNEMRPGRTLANPASFTAAGEVVYPRAGLAASGLLKVWLPLPLVTAAQPDVEIISLYPEKYLKYPVRLDGDMGLAYMEIPMEDVKEDLKIGFKVKFRHYEERFNIDPANVGSYDTGSAQYKRYTAPSRNIAITPKIKAQARKLAGGEKNPYLAAKKFYEHIVYDLDFSAMPHGAMDAMNIPESVYINEQGYGDSGSQSIYFAALCRSAGIPARVLAGWRIPASGRGSATPHFWAEVYLPNYGWVPVDAATGQMIKYTDAGMSLKKDFIDCFFSRLDPKRCLVQIDADIPLDPRPDEPAGFSLALQAPVGTSGALERSPTFTLMGGWKVSIK